MQICFFSDSKSRNFHPLTLTRPVDDLRIGLFTIRQKWRLSLSVNNISRIVPDYLEGVFPSGTISESKECLWINSRFLPNETLITQIQNLEVNSFLSFEGDIVVALIPGNQSQKFHSQKRFNPQDLQEQILEETPSIENYWDLIDYNPAEIQKDLLFTNLKPLSDSDKGTNFTHKKPDSIFIDDDVTIEPGVIIDASLGSVVIQKGATLEMGCILKGPVAVCEGSTVKMQAQVYGGSTIGPVCKVAGEISSSIFHSYSNKAHNGFAGNSIFGQWVNLGANTTTSNLKNDYGTIKVADWNTGKKINSEHQFFGTVIGDHSKTAINTSLNTGTICGVSSNIFVSGLTPTTIPSFSWLGDEINQVFRFEKAIDVMRAMMSRRNVELIPEYESMMRFVFDNR